MHRFKHTYAIPQDGSEICSPHLRPAALGWRAVDPEKSFLPRDGLSYQLSKRVLDTRIVPGFYRITGVHIADSKKITLIFFYTVVVLEKKINEFNLISMSIGRSVVSASCS